MGDLKSFLQAIDLDEFYDEFDKKKITYNQIIKCQDLNVFKVVFGEDDFHFSLFKDFVTQEKDKISLSNPNSPNRNANQNDNQIENQIDNEDLGNPQVDGHDLVLRNDLNNNNEESGDYNQENGHENIEPVSRKFLHVGQTDSLIRSIHDKLNQSEVKVIIKGFLKKVLTELNMKNFSSLDGKIILNSIFSIVVSHHPFLREDNCSGYVCIDTFI